RAGRASPRRLPIGIGPCAPCCGQIIRELEERDQASTRECREGRQAGPGEVRPALLSSTARRSAFRRVAVEAPLPVQDTACRLQDPPLAGRRTEHAEIGSAVAVEILRQRTIAV